MKNENNKLSLENNLIKSAWSSVFLILLTALVTGVGLFYKNQREEKNLKEVIVKAEKWIAFKNSNCKITEKIIGSKTEFGKFTYVNNFNVYKCQGDIKYTIEEKIDENMNNKVFEKISLENIPTI